MTADQANFGDPCLPGTRKQLRVSYTCGEWDCRAGEAVYPPPLGTSGVVTLGTAYLIAVPKQLLEEVGPDTSDPFLLSNYMHGNLGSRGETISCPIGMENLIAIHLRANKGVFCWGKEGVWHIDTPRGGGPSRPLVHCRWLVQRAQVLQAPGRPDDFY